MKIENNRIVLLLFLETIALCLIVSLRSINIESTATLLIFNLLFISLTFQLNGTFNRKLGVLALGNIFGLFWSFVFYYFVNAGALVFGGIFKVFYPFLNFMWVVSFWSLSLAAFPNPEKGLAEAKP